MFFPLFYGFLLPLSVAFLLLVIVSIYKHYSRKDENSVKLPTEKPSKDPYFLAPQYQSPALSPFGSSIKDADGTHSLTSNISRKNLRAIYSPRSVKDDLDLSRAQHLTATSPVLAAALEDVLRLSQEVFELRNARASLRTPSRPKKDTTKPRNIESESSTDSDEPAPVGSPLDSVLALSSPAAFPRPEPEGCNHLTEIDLGEGPSHGVWVRTDSITLV